MKESDILGVLEGVAAEGKRLNRQQPLAIGVTVMAAKE